MHGLNDKELKILRKIKDPIKVQDFLGALRINFEEKGATCSSPKVVLERGSAHCIEGAMLAALIFRLMGLKPLVMDLKTVKKDYDHVVALFKVNGYWGAVSKTNHPGLRYRDPVYKSVRELAMSYFNEYFLENRRKTMLSYSRPLDLSVFDKKGWVTSRKNLWYIAEYLDDIRHYPAVPEHAAGKLRLADKIEVVSTVMTEWQK